MSKGRRAIAALGLLAGSVGVMVTGGAPPASAQQVPGAATVAGNFFGDSREELFDYIAGPEVDLLVSYTNNGIPGGDIEASVYEFQVGGQYIPLPGDFDGDNRDEILWYAPGLGADSMWHFQSWTSAASIRYTINGTYQPVVGDFNGDRVDDIFWYAPGTAPDSVWFFRPGGSYTSVRYTVNGSYTPIAGSYGPDATDDIFWYGPGSVPDSLWDFRRGSTSYRSVAMPVSGHYRPFQVDMFGDGWSGGDIFWHTPSTGPDPVWDFIDGVRYDFVDDMAGDFSVIVADLFADGQDDIIWLGAEYSELWDHNGFDRYIYVAGGAAASDSRSAASERPVSALADATASEAVRLDSNR